MDHFRNAAFRLFKRYRLRGRESGQISFTGRTLEKLPLDVIARFLLFVPDLPSLQAAVISGPYMHEAYTMYRNTILQSVMEHELGPGLCFARAVYYASNLGTSPADLDYLADPQQYLQDPVTCKEAVLLSHYGCTAKRLAAYFSTLYKDRMSATSQLTRLEFFYFQRALFRFWVLSYLTKRPGWVDFPDIDKLGFCRLLTPDEIAHIADVHMMFYRLTRRLTDSVLVIGEGVEEFPDDLLQRFDNQVLREADTLPQGEHLSNKLHELYFALGMTNVDIWHMSRGLAGLDILVDGHSHSDICPRCNASHVWLWGETNWHLFRCFQSYRVSFLATFLPGNLPCSLKVKDDFRRYGEMIHYEPVREILSLGQRYGTDWSRDVYLCEHCFVKCFRKPIYPWYYETKTRTRSPEPSCPDGHDCKLLKCRMTDSEVEHDEKYSHLVATPSKRRKCISGLFSVAYCVLINPYILQVVTKRLSPWYSLVIALLLSVLTVFKVSKIGASSKKY